MFNHLSVKQLKALIAEYKAFHDIKNYHKMNKSQLVNALDQRFVVKEGKLHMKTDADGSDSDELKHYTALEEAPAPTEKKVPRKILPILVGPIKKYKRIRPVRFDEELPSATPRKTLRKQDFVVSKKRKKKERAPIAKSHAESADKWEAEKERLYQKYGHSVEDKHPLLGFSNRRGKKKAK